MHPHVRLLMLNTAVPIALGRLFAVAMLFAASGCTSIQLQKNSVMQAEAVGDFERQQVLNNLAMFVYSNSSMPYFSYPNQSGSTVTDQASAGATPTWGRPITAANAKHVGDFLFSALGLSFNGQRSQQEGFTITPVNDPRKLELMRCAYQQAVADCGCGEMSKKCPDCKTRLNTFYTGEAEGNIAESASGSVTSECLKGSCWFHHGCKHDVPKHCCCLYVGEYCGVYVWVQPDGREQLTRLTLAILDYALHDPPTKRSKEVVYFIDELGLPAPEKQAVGKVTAQVAVNEHPESLLNISQADEARIEELLESQLANVQRRLSLAKEPTERKAYLDDQAAIERKLEFLREQLRSQSAQGAVHPGVCNSHRPVLRAAAVAVATEHAHRADHVAVIAPVSDFGRGRGARGGFESEY